MLKILKFAFDGSENRNNLFSIQKKITKLVFAAFSEWILMFPYESAVEKPVFAKGMRNFKKQIKKKYKSAI